MKSFKVVELFPEKDDVGEALGVSRERRLELTSDSKEFLSEIFLQGKPITQVFEKLSERCKNANELVWVIFTFTENMLSLQHKAEEHFKPLLKKLRESLGS